MDAFHDSRPDENLTVRAWGRKIGQGTTRHLERDVGLNRAIRRQLIEIGPLDGSHQQGHAPQDPVVIQTFDQLQRLYNVGHHAIGQCAARGEVGGNGRIELDAEQVQDQSRDTGMVRQRLLLYALGGVQTCLLAIPRQRPDQRRIAPGKGKLHHQAIEAVVFRPSGPDGDHSVLERILDLAKDQVAATRVLNLEVVNPDGGCAGRRDPEPGLGDRLQAHVVQNRQNVGQMSRLAPPIELHPEHQQAVGSRAIGPGAEGLIGARGLDDRNVFQRLSGLGTVAVTGREGLAIARDGGGHLLRCPPARPDGGIEAIFPRTGGFGDLRLDLAQVRRQMLARREADDVVNPCQRAVVEARVIGGQPSTIGRHQQLARTPAKVGIVAVARHVQEDRSKPVERIGSFEQLYAGSILQVQDAHGLVQKFVLRDLEELISRMVLDDVAQSLFVVAAGRGAGPGHDPGDFFPDKGHLDGGLIVGIGGEQPDKPYLTAGPSVGAVAFDAHVIHVTAPVDAALHIGFGDGQRRVADDSVLDLSHQDGGLIGAAQDGPLRVAQHAQAIAGLIERLFRRVLAGLQARVFVDPRTQKNEVVGVQPP